MVLLANHLCSSYLRKDFLRKRCTPLIKVAPLEAATLPFLELSTALLRDTDYVAVNHNYD